jgi:hypothetical protein
MTVDADAIGFSGTHDWSKTFVLLGNLDGEVVYSLEIRRVRKGMKYFSSQGVDGPSSERCQAVD